MTDTQMAVSEEKKEAVQARNKGNRKEKLYRTKNRKAVCS